jgi:hypothetical protein
MSHAWVSVCEGCGVIGEDRPTEAAAQADADMHNRGERHPYHPAVIEEWHPGRHPIPH